MNNNIIINTTENTCAYLSLKNLEQAVGGYDPSERRAQEDELKAYLRKMEATMEAEMSRTKELIDIHKEMMSSLADIFADTPTRRPIV